MANPPFDASKAVVFDLARGRIHKEGSGVRVMISAPALVALCQSAGSHATRAFGRVVGDEIGAAALARFERAGVDPKSATIEAVIEHLGGELALAGFGTLLVERWGQALVLVVDHAPHAADGDELLGSVLESAVARATGADVHGVRLARDGERARFLMTGSVGADKVRGWLGSGVSWGEAIVRLHPVSGGGAA